MLNALLNQIQTQLLSKRFLLATLLPLFLFLFANGWMIWRHSMPFRAWTDKIDNLKDASILATILTTLVLGLAYALSALNATLLEYLEGKNGPLSWLRAPLYRYEQAKLQRVKSEYDAIALNIVLLQAALRPGMGNWLEDLKAAEKQGLDAKICDPRWPDSEEAREIKTVLHSYHFGREISFGRLQAAVLALKKLLIANSTGLLTNSSKFLKGTFGELQQAIFFARDFSQFKRVELYNKRQFYYPGDMNPGPDASPQNVLYPTAMGNIGSTMRSYAVSRYSLDLDIFWSRLQNSVQSDKDYFGVLQDVKVQLDFFVTSIWLASAFALMWTPIVFYKGTLLEFLAVGATGFLPLFLYSLGCDTYLLFADLMRGGVDLFRFKLAGSLHLPLPGGTEEERLFWTRLGNIIGYARDERFSYKHPGS